MAPSRSLLDALRSRLLALLCRPRARCAECFRSDHRRILRPSLSAVCRWVLVQLSPLRLYPFQRTVDLRLEVMRVRWRFSLRAWLGCWGGRGGFGFWWGAVCGEDGVVVLRLAIVEKWAPQLWGRSRIEMRELRIRRDPQVPASQSITSRTSSDRGGDGEWGQAKE